MKKIKWNIAGWIKYKDMLDYYINKYNLASEFDLRVYDSYFSPWSGGRLQLLMYDKLKFEKLVKNYNDRDIGFNVTFSAWDIPKEDFADAASNEQLEILSQGKRNSVIVVSKPFENYVRKNYPKLEIIYSVMGSMRDEIINQKDNVIVDYYNKKTEEYDSVVPRPEIHRRPEIMENLKNKERIELMVNHQCLPYCPDCVRHHSEEAKYIRGEMFERPFCSQKEFFELYLSLEEIEHIKGLGYSNFKLAGRDYELGKYNSDLFKYIILNMGDSNE